MPETLTLIDGHALAYRMYHALQKAGFSTADGEPTFAVFGFTRTVFDIIRSDDPPDYIAVSFDVGATFRDEIYEPYKATREEIPEDLERQIVRIREMLAAFNIPIVEMEGYEADDVLGTLSRVASERGIQTTIITGDTDLLQLVDENTVIQLHSPVGMRVYDLDAVQERYELAPQQLIDYKALVGDTSDNIPGVRGVGKKTATTLLKEYGSLHTIYDHLEDISSTRARNALTGEREIAELSYKLVTIVRDLALDFDLEACRTHEFDMVRVLELFKTLEFRSLLRQIQEEAEEAAGGGEQLALFGDDTMPSIPAGFDFGLENAPETETVIVRDEEALRKLVAELEEAERIAFDTETDSLDKMTANLVGISLSVRPGTGYYIPVGHQQGEQLPLDLVLEHLAPVLADPTLPKIAHNAKFDVIILARHGVTVTPIGFDTMIAEWLIDPSQAVGLKPTVKRRLDKEMVEIEALIGKGRKQITMAEVPIEDAAPYAAADADMTLQLIDLQRADMEKRGVASLFETVEMPLIPVLVEMEMAGILLDTDFLAHMSEELSGTLASLSTTIFEIAQGEFNLNSSQQLSEVLFDRLGLPTDGVRKTKSGYHSTAASVLESLQEVDETGIIDAILEYRSLEKLRSTYLDALPEMVNPETGRIHTSFNQTGTVTGRVSSSDPNLQNIPIRTEIGRRVRDAFVAAPGHVLLAADYSQVELRILAHMSSDKTLTEAFHQGQDIHATTAATVYNIGLDEITTAQRSFAKTVNFGLLYGMGAFRLARDSGMSRDEAQAFIDTYFERFPGVRRYLDETKQKAMDEQFVETLLGRKRYFGIFGSDSGGRRASIQRRAAEREAINMPVQGTAADIIKIAMVNLHNAIRERNLNAQMLLQVHDELVLEVAQDDADETLALVREVMESAYALDVPLKVDAHIGKNWGELK